MPIRALPYKNRENDGRCKLSEEDKKEIPKIYQQEKSIRRVAQIYGVDKRTIQFILHPERYEQRLKERRENKVHLKYHVLRGKEKCREDIAKYRAKKRKLGLLKSQQPKIDIDLELLSKILESATISNPNFLLYCQRCDSIHLLNKNTDKKCFENIKKLIKINKK